MRITKTKLLIGIHFQGGGGDETQDEAPCKNSLHEGESRGNDSKVKNKDHQTRTPLRDTVVTGNSEEEFDYSNCPLSKSRFLRHRTASRDTFVLDSDEEIDPPNNRKNSSAGSSYDSNRSAVRSTVSRQLLFASRRLVDNNPENLITSNRTRSDIRTPLQRVDQTLRNLINIDENDMVHF